MKQYTRHRHHLVLELDRVLEQLASFAGCDDTKQIARELEPCTRYADAVRELAFTSDAHMLTNRFGTPSISGIKPCSGVVARAKAGGMLSLRELLDIASLLKTVRGLAAWKRQSEEETSLDFMFSRLSPNQSLEEDITASILSEEELSDRASPELADIRRKIRQAGSGVRETLDRMIRSTHYQKFLQEQIVTIRNGRFVIPVRAEYRSEIKGLVHDTSSSGATLFVEPMSVVEANNRIRELESREQHEITRILHAFSARIGDSADCLLDNYDAVIQLDLYFAKSRLADHMRASIPKLVEIGETNLVKARHPLISSSHIVPIDIRLGGDFDTLVITGPNTGGKTVALKTLGLFTLMAACGLMLPCAEGSSVRIYRQVLADIGDEQSIEQSLSTFSGHMTNIISILQMADEESLVLMDELGAGTDPVEGAALAVSIISALRHMGARVAATTHYAEIKLFALQTQGVENASCEFDVSTLRPTYRLLIGVPGRSNAFAISGRLGLPEDIIEAARQQMSSESARFEDVVSGLEETRLQLERERELAEHYRREAESARQEMQLAQENLQKQTEQELAHARDQARGVIEQVRLQADQLLNELEDLKKQKDRKDFSTSVRDVRSTFRAYMRDLEDLADPVRETTPAYHLPRPLKRGDTVYLNDFSTEGTVLEEPDDNGFVRVQAGIIKTKVNITSLKLIDTSSRKVTRDGGRVQTRRAVANAKQEARSEVDLRGMTGDEAVLELDQYLDNAVLSGISIVTVIHGKGTGALRAAVQARLKQHRSVRTFRTGSYGEGESGVTIVELK